MPEVSVIIPTYNRQRCIERALKSVQNQTLEDIEIIVCDDASTDSTQDIIRACQKTDSRVQLLCLSENQGAGAARNLGMRAAKGEYIAFLDSDDEWLPEKLARQVARMDAEPQEIGACFCGATIIKNGNTARPVAYVPDKKWEHDTFRQFVTERIMFLTPTILLRRSCLQNSGLMVPEMRRNQDREFLLRLFSHYGLAVIPEPYVICHLVVSSEKKHYDAIKVAMPYRLCHRNIVRERLGSMTAVYYTCLLHLNLFQTAIRERRWREVYRIFRLRILVCPILFPKEIVTILKAFLAVFGFKLSRFIRCYGNG